MKPDEVRNFPNGQAEILTVGGAEVGRMIFKRGWRWSQDVKPIARTASCQAPHFQYSVSGRLAISDRIEQRMVREQMTAEDRAFIERMDMFFLATADAAGHPNCSYRGGDPGFVRVLDQHTLAFPNYDGNGMYLSMGNALENPHVGLLFIDFENQNRLRVNGTARIEPAASFEPAFEEAQFVVCVTVRQVFPNCARYIHKLRLVERSKFVPRAAAATPVPTWKRSDWAMDVLSANDPARKGS